MCICSCYSLMVLFVLLLSSVGGALSDFWRSIISSTPLVVLGIMRIISLKFTDYQEHASEYGIYWNFFFTLAVVKVS